MGETGAALYPFGLPEINMLEQIVRQLASIVMSEMLSILLRNVEFLEQGWL